VNDLRQPEHEALPEGEERPPPGVHAMAIVRWGLVALMALAAAGAWIYSASRSGVVVAEVRYHCPMHPQIVSASKGDCPICGMDLVPVAAAGARPDPAPVPPAPLAGGELIARQPLFTCPMHPEFVTADPRARCPQCGMKLVAREPAAAAAPAQAQGVAGLAPVDLTADRIQLTGMRTAAVAREGLSPTIRTAGFVTANENGLFSVTTRYSGWIDSLVIAQTGQSVAKGDVLATVYSPDMLNAQQVYLNAVKWADKLPATAAGQAPIGGDLQRDSRVRLELLGFAREDIEAIAKAGQPMQAVNVRAPVQGFVARKNALKGLYVTPGTELFQIADLSTVWVLADVYESEIGRVKVGQKASFEVAAYPGERFSGRVQFIYPALNPGSRTLQARLEFSNRTLKLHPGMYGDVTLELGLTEALVVPREALVDTGEVQYVFVARGAGRFEPRRVRVGWSGAGKVAILEGLAEGERVVTTANFLVDSESRLRAAVEGFAGPAR